MNALIEPTARRWKQTHRKVRYRFNEWQREKTGTVCHAQRSRIMQHKFSKKNTLPTWHSNDHRVKNQLDYLMATRHWRSAVQDVDCKHLLDSDHNPNLARMRLKLEIYRKRANVPRYNLAVLTISGKSTDYHSAWESSKHWYVTERDWSYVEAAKNSHAWGGRENNRPTKRRSKPWISDDPLLLIAKRARTRSAKRLKETQKRI